METSNTELREKARHYIAASEQDIAAMLDAVGKPELQALFDHIPAGSLFSEAPDLPDELPYDDLSVELDKVSRKNRTGLSFLGDGLLDLQPSPVVEEICNIRNLTTAYTPYQPELSQGTLLAHWIYQCSMARLTGFEAVNASLYERSTSIFEGICAAIRMSRKKDTAIIPETLYPGDMKCLRLWSRAWM